MAKGKTKLRRTASGLRDVLFEQIDDMRHGRGDPAVANSVANAARQIVAVTRMEMEFHERLARLDDKGKDVELGPLRLGDE